MMLKSPERMMRQELLTENGNGGACVACDGREETQRDEWRRLTCREQP